MFSKLFGTNNTNTKTQAKTDENEQKQTESTYSIYLKSQFGKMYCIDGLTSKSTIYDVKSRLEMIAGVAFSKMILTDDKIAKRLGVPVEEYSFPDEVLLKDLGIKDGEVLMWKKFHEKYIEQIPSEKIAKHQQGKRRYNTKLRQRIDTVPSWAKKEENKTFSITLIKNKADDETNKLLLKDLTPDTKISNVIKYIENDAQKRFIAHGLYKDVDRNITTFWQITPNEEVVWEDIYSDYVRTIERNIEEEEQLKLYEINYKAFEEVSDEKQGNSGVQSKIDIGKLLNGEKDALNVFESCLAKRGWVLVKYPDEIQKVIEVVCENVFNKLKEKTEKDKWERFHQFGFTDFQNYKQVLRVLTGDFLEYFGDKYPKELVEDIKKISNAMDKLTLDIINVSLEKIWGFKSMKEFSEKAPVSIVSGWNGNEKLKVGMIDFVKYLNEKEDKKNDGIYRMFRRGVNVESHTDPGIFSLSFLSTAEGLQLYDISTKQWVSIPIDCGVLWCGEAAPFLTDGRIKSGIHRVVLNKNGEPRYTAWYEASHHNQISRSVVGDISQ